MTCIQKHFYMELRKRIAFLWALVMGGFATHSLADLMPLFWSEEISVSDAGAAPVGMLVFMMTLSYLIPVAGMLCVLYSSSKAALAVNAALAVFTGLFCIFHMAELVSGFNPVQLTILPVMAVVGVLLAADSVKAARE